MSSNAYTGLPGFEDAPAHDSFADPVVPRPGGLANLKHDPRNARRHTPRNQGMIQESIQQNGFGRSLLVSSDGVILAGNATYDALAAAGMEDVIEVVSDGTKAIVVRRTDLDSRDPRAVALALSDNRAAELAEWDAVALQQIAIDFPESIDATFRPEELDSLLGAFAAAATTREPSQVALPPTPISRHGCVWRLGDHLLICGDSTTPETWTLHDQYHQDTDYRLLCTDPPYNFDIVGGVRDRRDPNHDAGGRELKRIRNDHMSDEDYGWLLENAFAETASRLIPGGGFYLFSPTGGQASQTFQQKVWSELGAIRQAIIWVKPYFVLSQSDYHWQHEMILYGWKAGAAHLPVTDRTQSTVWEAGRKENDREKQHPTMKPIELVARIIANGSQAGERVIDPFAGAGSTLLACEQLGRVCTAIELHPEYVDMIVERWREISADGEPELLEPGVDIPEVDLGE